MFLFLACETGVRYDKNERLKAVSSTVNSHEPRGGLVNRSIEELLNREDDSEFLDDDIYPEIISETEVKYIEEEDIKFFSNTEVSNGLDVRQVREGIHKDYVRLVFDIYKDSNPAIKVGAYDAKYNASTKNIEVVLHGYKSFSAPLPSFPLSSEIEQIHFEQYPEGRGFKFYIQLRKEIEVKIFDLKNPARLVFDIKAI